MKRTEKGRSHNLKSLVFSTVLKAYEEVIKRIPILCHALHGIFTKLPVCIVLLMIHAVHDVITIVPLSCRTLCDVFTKLFCILLYVTYSPNRLFCVMQ